MLVILYFVIFSFTEMLPWQKKPYFISVTVFQVTNFIILFVNAIIHLHKHICWKKISLTNSMQALDIIDQLWHTKRRDLQRMGKAMLILVHRMYKDFGEHLNIETNPRHFDNLEILVRCFFKVQKEDASRKKMYGHLNKTNAVFCKCTSIVIHYCVKSPHHYLGV